jgi:CcmD family protein
MPFLRVLVALVVIVGGWHAVPAAAQPPVQQEEFLPLDQLPPQDQLPAAPLLIAAYALVGLALFAYVISVGRRLTTVQQEIERLESDIKRSGRT